ncbi:hypothetical protein Lser_V15G26793 [Lactuca serriola]
MEEARVGTHTYKRSLFSSHSLSYFTAGHSASLKSIYLEASSSVGNVTD